MVPVIHCGVDMVSIARIVKAVERSGQRFLDRIFTDSELSRRDDPAFLATRFAAKEAFFKALGTGLTGGVRWKDFGLPPCEDGMPEAAVNGRSLDLLDGRTVLASVSHTSEMAVAVVFLQGAGGHE